MTATYIVTGTFMAVAGVSSTTLSGTIDITEGTVTAVDLVVPAFPLHFTNIYFNEFYNGGWLLSAQTPGSCECFGGQEDYITFNFTAQPQLLNFQQAKITNGAVVHNTYTEQGSTTTYYGMGLQGTICPVSGCGPFLEVSPPPHHAPGPMAGGGLAGLVMILVLVLISRFCTRQTTC